MKQKRWLAFAFWFVALPTSVSAQSFLVQEGQRRAEIIISETPTRMQRLAAAEFQQQIEKISGARLPIVTHPTGQAAKVFIGASEHNPVTAEGLLFGAYRITSGDDWLALIGDDTDFTPTRTLRAQQQRHSACSGGMGKDCRCALRTSRRWLVQESHPPARQHRQA